MPELPEVEVVRRGLTDWVAGRTIAGVEVHDARSVRRHTDGPEDFVFSLQDARVCEVVRRGKFLWLTLETAELPGQKIALMAHLGMSGQLLVEDAGQPWEKHLKVRLSLSPLEDTPGELRFVDQRIFGGMWLSPLVETPDAGPGGAGSADPLIPADAVHIARDALDPLVDPLSLRALWRNRRIGIKTAVMDQTMISGVGNIYADEALWRIRRHYETPVHRLKPAEIRELLAALHDVMSDALDAGGTSFDALYVNVNGASGYFDRSLKAYGREGEACQRCVERGRPGVIVREPWGGRSSYRCSWCQPRPRA